MHLLARLEGINEGENKTISPWRYCRTKLVFSHVELAFVCTLSGKPRVDSRTITLLVMILLHETWLHVCHCEDTGSHNGLLHGLSRLPVLAFEAETNSAGVTAAILSEISCRAASFPTHLIFVLDISHSMLSSRVLEVDFSSVRSRLPGTPDQYSFPASEFCRYHIDHKNTIDLFRTRARAQIGESSQHGGNCCYPAIVQI